MLKRTTQTTSHDGPVGLDDRPRPASSRARIIKGLKQSAPFSSLQRRIIFFNLLGLALLVAGMTYLSNDRSNLIEVYVEALRKQGEIVAAGIAEAAAVDTDSERGLDPERASAALARLAAPTHSRIRLYDLEGRLTADSYRLALGTPPMESRRLSPLADTGASGLTANLDAMIESLRSAMADTPPVYSEVSVPGAIAEEEVMRAVRGQIAHTVRMNSQGELIVSVAIPVRRVHAILGALRLSTAGGDIERFVREERKAVLEVFLLAAIVSVLLSIVLANMIASPIRELAKAAQVEGASAARPLSPDKPEIPDLTHRTDEIGELSDALIRMTGALYARIGAIESFAADVAHEIKNPLTSLRSAVETMQYAKTPEQQQKLLDVIAHDVQRMDRLVTDISNASRLDAELVRERLEPLDLGQLTTVLAEVTEQQGTEKDVKVVTDLPDQPLMTHGLEGRLAQVITNLLTNALSFSPRGGTIRVNGRELRGGFVGVTVEDEGPGIPSENLGSIFERFYSERPETEAFGGHSGLGLSISKQIIEAHGGRIWAENRMDSAGNQIGARFVFELPA